MDLGILLLALGIQIQGVPYQHGFHWHNFHQHKISISLNFKAVISLVEKREKVNISLYQRTSVLRKDGLMFSSLSLDFQDFLYLIITDPIKGLSIYYYHWQVYLFVMSDFQTKCQESRDLTRSCWQSPFSVEFKVFPKYF